MLRNPHGLATAVSVLLGVDVVLLVLGAGPRRGSSPIRWPPPSRTPPPRPA
ncbi:hypothetical protein ACFWGM_07620 [Streptomyces roseolus]|uniref:hypothetical protein n=1 Tax=Streptomyces roseolus TaxID=67358 RepID=UPI00363B72C5